MASGGGLVVVALVGVGALALMAFATLLVFNPPGGGQVGTQVFSFSATPDEGANFTLSVENVNGGIDIVPWGGVDVLVNGTISASGFGAAPSDVRLIPSISGSAMSLKVVPPAEGFLFGRQYNTPIRVYVPDSLKLGSMKLDTTNGALKVGSGTSSHWTVLSTVNGEISFSGIGGGAMKATTVNGGVTGRLNELSAGRLYTLSTTNGEVQLTVPREAAFSLTMQNINGQITTNGLGAMSVSQFSDHRFVAIVGGQGNPAKLSLDTVNGDLSISGA